MGTQARNTYANVLQDAITKARSVEPRQYRTVFTEVQREVRALVVMTSELGDPRHDHARQA